MADFPAFLSWHGSIQMVNIIYKVKGGDNLYTLQKWLILLRIW